MSRCVGRVVLINDFSVARGGATKLALDLAEGLSARGCDLRYFAGDDGVNPAFAAWGLEVSAVGGRRLLDSRRDGLVNGIFNRAAARALSDLISTEDRPDVIYHVHGWAQILSPSIFSALKPVADRVVVTAHDFFMACPNGNFMIYPKSEQCALRPLSAQCISTDCDKRSYLQKTWRVARQTALRSIIDFDHSPLKVIAIQKDAISYLERGGIRRSNIILSPNPVERLRAQRVIAERNAEFIYVGRLEHEKGVDLLAAAARRAGAPLRIIGEGPAEAAIRASNPDAQFAGWLAKDQLGDALGRARALVMPSRCTEPFGLAAAEALCVGVPVIASRSCLIGGDLERLGVGRMVDVFDAGAFASLLGRWKSDDRLIAQMSRDAELAAHEIGPATPEWIDAHLEIYGDMRRAAVRNRQFAPA